MSSANLRKLNRGEALTLADLSPETMRAFERAARTGELSHLVEPHVPWWTRASARDIKLRRDGTSVVAPVVVDEPESRRRVDGLAASPSFSPPEALSSDAPPPPIEDTPLVPLHALLAPGAKRAGPSPALRWHALDVLAAYTLATRAHDGDWRADLAAARDLVAFSPTLAAAADTTARASGASRTLVDGAAASLEAKEKKAAAPPRASRPPRRRRWPAWRRRRRRRAVARVAAAAAAAAASGLTHRDVRDVFRGGGAPWS